ncbi:hypothetical protein GQ600_27362 [Phytophthora cactorum]|nr:hypothetical protein GQ600_27362 [Phytophthora cactorum]
MAECVEGVHRFTPSQRILLLQGAGIPDGIITRHARETNIILGSRRRSKTSWEDSELDEAEEDEDEGECKELSRKRSTDQATLEHPCAVFAATTHDPGQLRVATRWTSFLSPCQRILAGPVGL